MMRHKIRQIPERGKVERVVALSACGLAAEFLLNGISQPGILGPRPS